MQKQRRRFKHTQSLRERLTEEADQLREKARALPFGPERDDAIRRARHAEAAAHMDEWLSSPGVRAPT